jgi:hypothetical protein
VELVVGVVGVAEASEEALDDMATRVLTWIGFLHRFHSFRPCSEHLRIYMYLTDFCKVLPRERGEVLDQEHVNTAFTRSCQKNNEIVLFRREEWFKVLMHESFHSFGLDFSEITVEEAQRTCNRHIRSMFPVASEVKLYEAYTEFWAEMLHCCFQSFFYVGGGGGSGGSGGSGTMVRDILDYGELAVHVERLYSVFQLVKVLHFMGLTYQDLVGSDGGHGGEAVDKRRRYSEKTNVLAYYVLKNVLLQDYNDFLRWCHAHNSPSIMQFHVTPAHIEAFCVYIRKHYRSASLLEDVACTETLWQAMGERSFWREAGVSAARERWVRTNLRMTLMCADG